jgi:hypothetical protein
LSEPDRLLPVPLCRQPRRSLLPGRRWFWQWRRLRLRVERRRTVLIIERLVVEELHSRAGKDDGDARWVREQRFLSTVIFVEGGERALCVPIIIGGARWVRRHRCRVRFGKRITWSG